MESEGERRKKPQTNSLEVVVQEIMNEERQKSGENGKILQAAGGGWGLLKGREGGGSRGHLLCSREEKR